MLQKKMLLIKLDFDFILNDNYVLTVVYNMSILLNNLPT